MLTRQPNASEIKSCSKEHIYWMYKIRSCNTIHVFYLLTNTPLKPSTSLQLSEVISVCWRELTAVASSICFVHFPCAQLFSQKPEDSSYLRSPRGNAFACGAAGPSVLISSFYQRFTRVVKTALTPHTAEAQPLLFLHHQLEFLFAETVDLKAVSPPPVTF